MTVIKNVDIDMVAAVDARTSLTTGTDLFAGDLPPASTAAPVVSQVAVGIKMIGAPPSERYVRGNAATGEMHRDVAFVVTARGSSRDRLSARNAVAEVIAALHCNPPTGYLGVRMGGAPYDVPETDGNLDIPYCTVEGFADYEE